MAASPGIKIYSSDNEYIASCKYYEDAAALVAVRGAGATVRIGHTAKTIVWREGYEEFSAAESYDKASEIMSNRAAEQRARWSA